MVGSNAVISIEYSVLQSMNWNDVTNKLVAQKARKKLELLIIEKSTFISLHSINSNLIIVKYN